MSTATSARRSFVVQALALFAWVLLSVSGQADERLGTRSVELQQIIDAASSGNSSGIDSKIDQMSPATKFKLQNDLRRLAEEGSSGARRCPRWLQFIYAAMACAQGQGCEEIAKVLAGGELCEEKSFSFDDIGIIPPKIEDLDEESVIQQAIDVAQKSLDTGSPSGKVDLELGADVQANCEVKVKGVKASESFKFGPNVILITGLSPHKIA